MKDTDINYSDIAPLDDSFFSKTIIELSKSNNIVISDHLPLP